MSVDTTTRQRTLAPRSVGAGVIGAIGISMLYVFVVALASGSWDHLVEQLRADWYLPFIGAGGAATFLYGYKIPFVLGGVGINVIGVVVAARRLRRTPLATPETTRLGATEHDDLPAGSGARPQGATEEAATLAVAHVGRESRRVA